MEAQHLSQLKKQIEKTLGRKIVSSTDCRLLHNDISQQSHSSVSFNTLRRFFNLMDSKHESSVYTLDALAGYCGFSSFEDFTSSAKRQSASTENHANADLINYLVMLFKDTEVTSPTDKTYLRLVKQTIIFLQHHAELIDPFQREIARTHNGQTVYFEQNVNIDSLNDYYGNGIKYYLHYRKNIESVLFGNFLLSFKCWLTMDKPGLEKYSLIVSSTTADKKMLPEFGAYYFCTQLLQAETLGADRAQILLKLRDFFMTVKPTKENYQSLIRFYEIVPQMLVLTGEYEEALFYINEVWKNKKKYIFPLEAQDCLEAIRLFEAMAVARLGEKTKARQLLGVINPNNFNILARQYMTILYLSVRQILRKTLHDQKQLKHLVGITGFVRLNNW